MTNLEQTASVGYQEPTKIWNPLFINVVIVNIAMNFGQFMMNTLISKFANYLGATSTVVGMIASMFTITALLVKPISGPAIDTFSKKKILCGAILVIMVAFITYGSAHSVGTIVVARLIHGCGMGFTASTCLALASDALPKDKLTQGIGYFSLGQAIVSAVGPTIGLSLVKVLGYNMTFFVGAAMMGAAAILAATMKVPPQTGEKKKLVISLSNMFAKEAIIPAVFLFFLAMSYGTISSFLVLYAQEERGVEQIGLFFTVNALCLLVTRPVIGKLADKFGIHKVLLPAFCMFALSLFMISISDSLPMFLMTAVINACGYGAAQPTIQALCMKCVTPERRGVGGSTNYIGTDLGYLIGPTLSGMLVSNFGYSAMYRFMILPILAACVVFFIVYPKIKAICTK